MWQVKRIGADKQDELDEALANGWEPFAVVGEPNGSVIDRYHVDIPIAYTDLYQVMWLRRQLSVDIVKREYLSAEQKG